jgi:AcrR family transcriptional regulator
MHPLALIRHTKTRADQLRSELAAAEREHHEAVLVAAREADEDGVARFTIADIAEAAQCSRGRIYKRLGKPSYGDRSTAKAAYQ